MAVRTLWLMPLLLFAAPCVAGPTQQERIEHFWLFAHCRPMRLVVEIALGSPAFADLETPIRDAVESRMRAARLLTTQNAPLPALYVEVEGYQDLAFNVKLTFKKWLYDPIVNDTWLAATWMSGYRHGRPHQPRNHLHGGRLPHRRLHHAIPAGQSVGVRESPKEAIDIPAAFR